MESGLIKRETEQLPKLNDREQHALQLGRNIDPPRIALSTSAQMFELFLNGKSTEAIQKLNPGFSLAQIVLARVEGRWDEQKALYEAQLMSGVRERAVKAHLETITLISDMMVSAVKLHGEKHARYQQTGDEKELQGALKINNIKDLKDLVVVLMKATGQDQQPVTGEIVHRHEVVPAMPMVRALESAEADEVLRKATEKKG